MHVLYILVSPAPSPNDVNVKKLIKHKDVVKSPQSISLATAFVVK